MTLDDTIEPESKFVSVQQCQRPIYDCKINEFNSIAINNREKIIILFSRCKDTSIPRTQCSQIRLFFTQKIYLVLFYNI